MTRKNEEKLIALLDSLVSIVANLEARISELERQNQSRLT